MTALVVKNFRAAEGRFNALGDFFKAVLGDTRAFAGCINVDVIPMSPPPPIPWSRSGSHSLIMIIMSLGELLRVIWIRLGVYLMAVSKTASQFMSGEIRLIFKRIAQKSREWIYFKSRLHTF